MRNKKNLVLILLAGAAILFYLSYQRLEAARAETQAEIESRFQTLSKYRAMAGDVEGLKENTEELARELAEYEAGFIEGDNPSLGMARIQGIVARHASEAGLLITTIKPLATIEHGAYLEVPLQADLKGRVTGLADLIRAIEGDSLALRVAKLSVQSTNEQRPEELTIKITVHGMMKP